MGRLIHFIKYNNALPIAFAVIFLSATGTLAANDDVRAALVSSEQKIASVDNSYIRSVNLNAFTPSVQITDVSEDEEWYFVSYTLSSIGIEDGVWRDVTKGATLKVSKQALGERDLGLYVTKELKELVDREVAVLRETQQIEQRAGETPKVIATAYSGLVGKFLDPKEEVIEGYDPVKPPPPPPQEPISNDVVTTNNNSATSSGGETTTTVTNPANGDTTPPSFQILGNNPARVEVGSNWSDLGAYVTDNRNPNIGYTTEGVDAVDTDTVGEYLITYRAVDEAGNTATATRTVIVYDPNDPDSGLQQSNSSDTNDTTTDSTSNTSTTTTSTTTSTTTTNNTGTIATSTEPTSGNNTTTENSDSTGSGDTASSTPSSSTDEDNTATTTEPVADTTPPSITLVGSASVSIEEGSTYTDAGATATDDVDGDISGEIVTSGSIDASTPGDYTITYDVSDAAGNTAASVTRTITVTAAPEPESEAAATSTDDGTTTETASSTDAS